MQSWSINNIAAYKTIYLQKSCKAAFTRQTNVGQLKLVCVNDTTTCWQTVDDK